MEQAGTSLHTIRVLEMVEVTHIVLVGEDKKGKEVELIVASNRRTLPVPYTEEP